MKKSLPPPAVFLVIFYLSSIASLLEAKKENLEKYLFGSINYVITSLINFIDIVSCVG